MIPEVENESILEESILLEFFPKPPPFARPPWSCGQNTGHGYSGRWEYPDGTGEASLGRQAFSSFPIA